MAKEAAPDAAKKILNFRRWFGLNGGSVHASVDILYTDDDGVHVRANAPIPPGTTIMTCPHRISLSALNAIDLAPTFPSHGTAVPSKTSKNLPPNMPSGLMESAPSRQAAAAVWLCVHQRLGASSFWRPYIDCLPRLADESQPKDAGLGELDTPLCWTDEEKKWFAFSPLEKGVSTLEGAWRSGWDAWGTQVQSWARSLNLHIDWEQYKWALSMYGSRAFSSATLTHATLQDHQITSWFDPDALLYPGIDMLNHSPTTLNRWVYDENGFSLVCNDSVKAGDQIFNTYGAKNNGQLMLSYGFCLPHNPHEAYPLKLPPAQDTYPLTPADLAPQSNAVRSANATEDAILQMAPSVVPEGHDPSLTTFYVRAPGSGNAERRASRPHYPPLEHIFSVTGRIREDQLSQDAEGALSGFPTALLNALSLRVASPRESAHIAAHAPALRALLQRGALLAARLGPRNWLAVAGLLLDRLRLETGRLSARLDTVRNTARATTAPRAARFRRAVAYMMGAQTILQPTLALLEAGILGAIARDGVGAAPPVLTLHAALAHLAAAAPGACAALLAGYAGTADAAAAVALARGAGAEEDLWTLWLGATLALGGADALSARVGEWAARAERETACAGGVDAQEHVALCAHVAELVAGVRGALGPRAGEGGAVWGFDVWTPALIARASLLVRCESVSVGVQDGRRRRRDEDDGGGRAVVLCLDAGLGAEGALGELFR